MRKSLSFIIAAIAAFLAFQFFSGNGFPFGKEVTEAQIEEEIMKQPGAELYMTIKSGFPDAYATHLSDLKGITNNADLTPSQQKAELFRTSRDFTEGLRQDNAEFITTAPRANLIEVQQASLDVLLSVRENSSLCARIAASGFRAIRDDEKELIDIGLMARTAHVNFNAIVAGRDTPVDPTVATGADRKAFFDAWTEQADVPPEAIDAFLKGRVQDSTAYCAGAISFQQQLIVDDAPGGQGVLADVTKLMVSG